MNSLRLLVENLVLIIVLAVFLEMLLPAGTMGRYVNLVVGLMIIVAVLQAATGVLGRGLSVNLPFIDHAVPPDMDQALRAGRQLAQQDQADALKGYQAALERQIKALGSLNGDLTVESVRADVPGDRASPSFGSLAGVTVGVKVKPGLAEDRVTADMDGLRRELANFYNLKPETVSVDLEKGVP